MHCQLCGHGPVINGVCGACHGRPGHPSPYGPAPYGRAPGIPPLLWLPIGAFALTALVGLITFLTAVSAASSSGYRSYDDYYGTYDYSSTGGLLAGTVGLLVFLGAGLVTFRLIARRPAARAFALTGSIAYLFCSLFDGEVRSAASVLPALLCTGAAVALAVAPSLRAVFVPPAAPPARRPTSIIVARTMLAVSGAGTAVYALVDLFGAVIALTLGASASRAGGELGSVIGGVFGAFGGLVLAAGLVCAGFAAVMFWSLKALGSASRAARVVVTVLGSLNLLAALLFFAAGIPESFPLSWFVFDVVLIGALWFPADARRHFGEPPLPAVERARGAVVGLAGHLSTITTTPPASYAPASYAPPIPMPRPPAPPYPSGGVSGRTPVPSGGVGGHPPVPAFASGAATVAPRQSGRHAADRGPSESSGSGDGSVPEPPTERFTAVAPAAVDEPATQPVPVVGPAAGHGSVGTDT